MKKAILAAVLLVACAIFAGAEEDIQYPALTVWFGQIALANEKWNDTFVTGKGDPMSPGAKWTRQILNQQMFYFVTCANRYTIHGEDCEAQLRFKAIQHDIALFIWQIRYGGRPLEASETSEAEASSNTLHEESVKLGKEISECLHE